LSLRTTYGPKGAIWILLLATAMPTVTARSAAQLVMNPPRRQAVASSSWEIVPDETAAAEFLPCSTDFCLLPSVQASPGPFAANSTAIAVNPQNSTQLMAAANDLNCPSGVLGAYGSSDGGSTWNHTCMGVENTVGTGLPSVVYDLSNNAYFAATDTGVYPAGISVGIQKSTDNGTTWGATIVAVQPEFTPNGLVNAPWLEIDDGTSSHYTGTLYISGTQFDYSLVKTQISVSSSSDGGNTWTTMDVAPVQIEPKVDQFSRLAIGSDGTIYVAWQRCVESGEPNLDCGGTKARILLSKSTDGGSTWSKAAQVATVTLAPDSCNCASFGNLPNTKEPVYDIPLVAIDNSTGSYAGSLYVALYNWTGKQMRVELVASRNGGKSWEKPVEIAPASATHDQFFPAVSVSSSGLVGVSWLDRRNDPANLKYQPFAAISTNGGATFGTNHALTRKLSNPYLDGYGGVYMGAYTSNAWVGGMTFYATWPDSGNQQYMQDHVGGGVAK
jgi:hypothetical protein